MNATNEAAPAPAPKNAPVKATWVCLIVAWVLFLLPLPGVGLFVGWPLNLVAFILAIVVMARGSTSKGLIPLLASLVVSPIVYFIGVAVLVGAAGTSSAYSDYKARAEAAAGHADTTTQVEQAAPAADAIKVSARDLFRAYDANEVAADGTYKGKPLEVTGTVESISSDFTDEPVVQLATGEMFQQVHASGLSKTVAGQLSKGQKITVQCTGGGEIVGMPALEHCSMQ